jgi:hypothetical protein
MTLTPSICCPRPPHHDGGIGRRGRVMACPPHGAAVSDRRRPVRVENHVGISGPRVARPSGASRDVPS